MELNPNAIKFTNPSYDTAIIGTTQDGNLVYDYEKIVIHLVETETMSEEDAIEFIEYNVLGVLLNIPIENRPIILYQTDNDIIREFL